MERRKRRGGKILVTNLIMAVTYHRVEKGCSKVMLSSVYCTCICHTSNWLWDAALLPFSAKFSADACLRWWPTKKKPPQSFLRTSVRA